MLAVTMACQNVPPPHRAPPRGASQSPSTDVVAQPTGSPPATPTESPPPPEEPERVEVRSITIDLDSEELTRGMTVTPEVTVLPNDATDKTYDISSSDEDVLRIVDGYWTAVGAGVADLIVIAGNGVTATAAVTVTVPVEAIQLSTYEMTMNRGDIITLTPVIYPEDATDQEKHYFSSDESVATVSEYGVVTAVGIGTTTISITVSDIVEELAVTVVQPVTGVSVSADQRFYKVGDQGRLTIRITPEDATDSSYTISFSGAAASLSGDDTFSCDGSGELTIIVTAANGVANRQTVTVVDLGDFADEVFRLTNVERANVGLPPLARRDGLTQTAEVRARETIQHFSHSRPDGRSCFTAFDENNVTYRKAGENIAMGQRTPAEVVRAWMNSTTGHREAILDGDYGHLGVGVAMDANGRLYWAQAFTD